MTNYIILILCIIIVLAYIFDVTSKYSKIPGVILLIALGIAIQVASSSAGIRIPNLKPLLPVIGTLGLIMIVMEASLDIELRRSKKSLIKKSVSSAFVLFALFTAILSFVLVRFYGFPTENALLNAMPLGIISSSIAIPSSAGLKSHDREFIVYESSFSDIFGIMFFDFILLRQTAGGPGVFAFVTDGLLTVLIAVVSTAALGYLLHKINYHISYVIIITSIILVYTIAKLLYLPALLLVLIFGLTLSNNRLLENSFVNRFVDFEKFRKDISSFKKILSELTFLVRSFFFIMFGYYTSVNNLFSVDNLLVASGICVGMFIIRWAFFKFVLQMPAVPLTFFSPRGLITILLFLSIPEASKISYISEEVVTLVILISIVIMALGNMLQKKEKSVPY